ncbi:hypothetical protein CANCADRAFT_147344 [Tortispora caseinolytica NRRL Y-17796]|uniref:Uncharacterized protein n=1 Tax=Tortispora caseinolytica NRRL Y-17796 TaxID=767744 RepID=A0A1E4TIX7_9ASCO|nr:hypothetical protein CANCADRAFT_147344 [Tortispora caseinolytica NRRL Y-17796]
MMKLQLVVYASIILAAPLDAATRNSQNIEHSEPEYFALQMIERSEYDPVVHNIERSDSDDLVSQKSEEWAAFDHIWVEMDAPESMKTDSEDDGTDWYSNMKDRLIRVRVPKNFRTLLARSYEDEEATGVHSSFYKRLAEAFDDNDTYMGSSFYKRLVIDDKSRNGVDRRPNECLADLEMGKYECEGDDVVQPPRFSNMQSVSKKD